MSASDGKALAARDIALPAALLVAGVSASIVASRYIGVAFPLRPEPADLLFEVLPYVPFAEYTADAAVVSAILMLVYYAIRRAPARLPRMLSVFALMYLLRAVMIVLTPLAAPYGVEQPFGFMPMIQNGMWPSGHAAATMLCVLLIDRRRAPWLSRAALVFAVAEWVSLLLARGHYSIDIIGGLLLAYFVYHEWVCGRLFNPLKRLVEPAKIA